MVQPDFLPRLKKRGDAPCLGVNSGEVRAFLKITTMAGESQIGKLVGAAMLLGDDMFDMKGEWTEVVAELAVLASIGRSMADLIAGLVGNHCLLAVAKRRWAFNLRMPIISAALIAAS